MGEEEEKEEKKDEEPLEIVLKVDMHCEACARKVARSLKGFEGVENVSADSKASKVVVRGKTADPMKICERLQKKSGRKVELISPLPKPPPEPADLKKEESNKDQPKEDKKDEPPAIVTVVLKVRMHCEACAQVLQKRIRKIKGVESVETDFGNDHVIVKGVVDSTKLAEDVFKKTRKQVLIVKNEEKKEEEKKEEGKKDSEKPEETKKYGDQEGKNSDLEDDDKKMMDMKRSEFWTSSSRYYTDYSYPSPQIFSDENPNACSLM